MKRVMTAVVAMVVILGLFGAGKALAKDVHNQIADIAGLKTAVVKLKAKPSKSSATKSKKASLVHLQMEFVYVGHDELLVIDDEGARPVEMEFGGDSFSWEGYGGFQYTLQGYPYDNDHATLIGTVYDGLQMVGRFRFVHGSDTLPPTAGTWDGTLAFPGGAMLPLSLQVAATYKHVGDTCISHPTRIQFPGRPYAETELSLCADEESGNSSYGAAFFYFDERHGDRWFVSITVTETEFPIAEVLQGSAWIMSLDGSGGMSEGFFYAERPARFQLMD